MTRHETKERRRCHATDNDAPGSPERAGCRGDCCIAAPGVRPRPGSTGRTGGGGAGPDAADHAPQRRRPRPKPSLEIYGFAMLDIGHDFKQIDPNWSDTLRLTKLPSSPNQFGEDNNTFAGVRQSRLGVKRRRPTERRAN